MKTKFLLSLLIVLALVTVPNFVSAQTKPFTYQGQLVANGAAANGTYDLTFGLCTNVSSGTAVGTVLTNLAVAVSNGLFTTTLSFSNNFDGTAYWLEIGVRSNASGAFTALSPRQALTPAPYAITAYNVTGSVPASQLTGSLPASVLSSLYATAVDFTNPANVFQGNGSGLTNLSAAQLAGTIADARLSTNVVLFNGANLAGRNTAFSVPVAALVTSVTNYAVVGINNAVDGTSTGGGVYAQTSQSSGFGVFAQNKDPNGTGIIAVGNNQTVPVAPSGTGVAAYGLSDAIFAQANASTGAFAAVNTFLTSLNNQVLVNYYNGTTLFKIAGNGTVSTVVADATNDPHIMFAPEAPEVFFEDYGAGRLTNGSTHITLDPLLAANIAVSPAHPLRAFVQVEGDCKGVYVANQTAAGFDVIELGSGTSNVPFSWHVVANRADEEQVAASKAANGSLNAKIVSHYSTQRFPVDRNFKTAWHAVKTPPLPQN